MQGQKQGRQAKQKAPTEMKRNARKTLAKWKAKDKLLVGQLENETGVWVKMWQQLSLTNKQKCTWLLSGRYGGELLRMLQLLSNAKSYHWSYVDVSADGWGGVWAAVTINGHLAN